MDVVVPREIDGVTVVGFKDYNAFASCQDYTDTETETNQTDWVRLRTLVLPETIKALPDSMPFLLPAAGNLRLLRAAGEHRQKPVHALPEPEQRDLCQRRAHDRQLCL